MGSSDDTSNERPDHHWPDPALEWQFYGWDTDDIPSMDDTMTPNSWECLMDELETTPGGMDVDTLLGLLNGTHHER